MLPILEDIEAGEEPQTLAKACRDPRLCVDGKPHTLSWAYRAAMHGCRGADGQRVKLETFTLAGKLITTKSAIGRFIARQAGLGSSNPNPHTPTPMLGVAHAAAKRRLAKAGF